MWQLLLGVSFTCAEAQMWQLLLGVSFTCAEAQMWQCLLGVSFTCAEAQMWQLLLGVSFTCAEAQMWQRLLGVSFTCAEAQMWQRLLGVSFTCAEAQMWQLLLGVSFTCAEAPMWRLLLRVCRKQPWWFVVTAEMYSASGLKRSGSRTCSPYPTHPTSSTDPIHLSTAFPVLSGRLQGPVGSCLQLRSLAGETFLISVGSGLGGPLSGTFLVECNSVSCPS